MIVKERYEREGSTPIARDLGVTRSGVQKIARKLGLKYVDQFKNHSAIFASKNKSCDNDYFKTWTPNMAYILGYIYADGSIGRYVTSFRCHRKDESLLLAIHQELRCTGKFHRIPATIKNGRNNGPQAFFHIGSRRLVLSLMEHGLLPRKSELDLPLPFVPDVLFGHFLRGYFDGDGHVSHRNGEKGGNVSVCGSHSFIVGLHASVCDMTGAAPTEITEETCGGRYSAKWGCHSDLVSIHGLMYPGGTYIFLARKREVFDSVVAEQVKPMRSQAASRNTKRGVQLALNWS
jgi:hypothetical protein